MPQLDLTGFPPQIIWLVITFIVLWLLMARVALPRISSVLEERQARIDDNLDAAQNLRNEAEAELEAYEKTLADAREQARQAIQQAHGEATADAAARQEELGQRLANDVKDAEARIAKAKDDAIAGIRDVAADTASAITERLIGATASADAFGAAVDTAMKDK